MIKLLTQIYLRYKLRAAITVMCKQYFHEMQLFLAVSYDLCSLFHVAHPYFYFSLLAHFDPA